MRGVRRGRRAADPHRIHPRRDTPLRQGRRESVRRARRSHRWSSECLPRRYCNHRIQACASRRLTPAPAPTEVIGISRTAADGSKAVTATAPIGHRRARAPRVQTGSLTSRYVRATNVAGSSDLRRGGPGPSEFGTPCPTVVTLHSPYQFMARTGCGCDDGERRPPVCSRGSPLTQRVGDCAGLFLDLLEHEVVVAALLGGGQVPVDMERSSSGVSSGEVGDLVALPGDRHDLS